jgi:hypothetical protein
VNGGAIDHEGGGRNHHNLGSSSWGRRLWGRWHSRPCRFFPSCLLRSPFSLGLFPGSFSVCHLLFPEIAGFRRSFAPQPCVPFLPLLLRTCLRLLILAGSLLSSFVRGLPYNALFGLRLEVVLAQILALILVLARFFATRVLIFALCFGFRLIHFNGWLYGSRWRWSRTRPCSPCFVLGTAADFSSNVVSFHGSEDFRCGLGDVAASTRRGTVGRLCHG